MKVWKQFDIDCSGYIEADELKQFIKILLNKRQGNKTSEEKLIEYTDAIVCEEIFFFSIKYFVYLFSYKSLIQMVMENYNSVK
jgi:Ca2+-binding EF-hand superfamily protein